MLTFVFKVCQFLLMYFFYNYIISYAEVEFSSQIRTTLKKKAFEDAGIPVRQIVSSQSQGMLGKSSEVTLNMLNAPESEVDVEGMHEDVKLEFGSSHEEVTS